MWFCLFPALAAVSALVGWTFQIESLKTVFPGMVAMNPLAAVCWIALSAALWLRVKSDVGRLRQISTGLALAVALVGGQRFGAFLLGFDFRPDLWLFPATIGNNDMAPNAALCFLLMGLAVSGIDRVTARGFWPSQAATLIVGTVSLVTLIGYSFWATSMDRVASYTPMAFATAISFGVISFGLLLARPQRGVVAVVLDPGAGGVMARRLLPAMVIIPWFLGGLRVFGQQMGYYDTEFGAALMIAVTVMLFVVAVHWIAAALNRSDAERREEADLRQRAEEAVCRLNAGLEQRVADRTAELAAANADLSEKSRENEMFVYSASHDLRSPLVNLQGFSQELVLTSQNIRELIADGNWPAEKAERGLKLIDVDMQRGIHFIQTGVSRLDGIIDALLRLSRTGRVEYRPQAIDVNDVVARLVESMSGALFDHGVTVDIADLPTCWCDPTAAEQIFANLIGNAVNYLDAARPGKIEIGCRPTEATGDGEVPASTYFVKDNGLGIDPAHRGKIFQALKRLHPTVAKGEGIGLAIVKRIVDRHGGKIWFDSAVGEGTTFFVELPNRPMTGIQSRDSLPEQSRAEASDAREALSETRPVAALTAMDVAPL